MKDQRMVEIITKDGSLYVYTYLHGSKVPKIAFQVVQKLKTCFGDWGDDSYTVHFIVDQLTKLGRDKKTEWGLMLRPEAEDKYNENKPSIIIDLVNQTFSIIEAKLSMDNCFQFGDTNDTMQMNGRRKIDSYLYD